MASRDARHHNRHTTRGAQRVRLTVLVDIPELSMRPVKEIEPALWDVVPRTVRAIPGDEIAVSEERAARLVGAGKAVPVDVGKLGKGQKRLLAMLLELSRRRHIQSGAGNQVASIFWGLRNRLGQFLGEDLRSPVAEQYRADDEVQGDLLWRRESVRVRWRPSLLLEHFSVSVTMSTLSQALRGLERRGLVLRDVTRGVGGRTGTVELTTAGWRVAEALTTEARRAERKG